MFPGDRLYAVNVPDDDPFNQVLHDAGVPVALSQSEMDLNLTGAG